MGRSKSEARCKKHPNNTQSPGVCSFCLRERLSRLSSSRSTIAASCSSSTSCSSSPSYYSSPSCYSSGSGSSSSPSSCSSPAHHLSSSNNFRVPFGLFGRSLSAAFVARYRTRDGEAVGEGMKKGGFWSKLLRTGGKGRKEGFVHSNIATNEMAASANMVCI